MATKTYTLNDFNIPVSWKYSCSEINETGVTQYKCSSPSSSSADKTIVIDSTVSEYADSITLTWGYDTGLSNGNSNILTKSGYGAGSYSYIRAYVLDSSGNRTYTSKVYTKDKTMTIPLSYLKNNKIFLRFTYHPDPGPDYWDVNTESGSWKTSYTSTGTAYWENVTLTINYTPYNKLTTPSITSSPATLLPNGTYQLTWSAASASGASNNVKSYTIYKSGVEYKTGITGLSYDIKYDIIGSDKEATFTVQAISDVTGYNSNQSSSVVVKCYKNIEASNLELNVYTSQNSILGTNIYVGKESQPNVTFSWGSLSGFGGKYDSISSISLTNCNNILTKDDSFTSLSSISSTTTYQLVVNMASGQMRKSNEVTVNIASIDGNNVKFVSHQSGAITGPEINFKWTAAMSGNGEIKYELKIKEILQEVSTTSTTFNIKDIINNKESYTCTLTPKVYPEYGGYTLSIPVVISLERAPELKITGPNDDGVDSPVIEITSDTKNPNYGWNTFGISINNSGNYSSIIVKANSTELQDYTESNNIRNYIHSLNSNDKGKSITYTFDFVDNYGETATYTVADRIGYLAPNIDIVSMEDSNKTITLSFKAINNFNFAGTSSFKYKIIASYKGEEQEMKNGDLEYIDSNNSISFNMKYDNLSGLSILQEELNKRVVGKPFVSMQVKVWDNNISDGENAYGVSANTYQLDYLRYPHDLELSFDKGYYSSGETITLTPKANFTYPSGTTVEEDESLIYQITRDKIQIKNNTEILGDITEDIEYTYVLTVIAPYEDGFETKTDIKVPISVRKYLDPTITVSNLVLSDTGLSGTINYSINGSSEVDNIESSKIIFGGIAGDIILYDFNGEEIENIKQNTISNEIISFSALEQTEQTTATFTITTISTGGVERTATYGPILIKISGIPLAIRKEGIGIHTPNDFNPSSSDAAFKVVGNSSTNVVAEFENNTNQSETRIRMGLSTKSAYLSLETDPNGAPYFAIIFPE